MASASSCFNHLVAVQLVGKKLTIINNKFLNCPFKTMKVVDTMDGSYMSWEFVEGSSGLSSIGFEVLVFILGVSCERRAYDPGSTRLSWRLSGLQIEYKDL